MLRNALAARFVEVYGRTPTEMELGDFAFAVALDIWNKSAGFTYEQALARIQHLQTGQYRPPPPAMGYWR